MKGILATVMLALSVSAHAQNQPREVMTCGVGGGILYSVSANALKHEIVMRACGAPINREKVPLTEVYTQGWRLIQAIKTSERDSPLDVSLFIFER